MKGKTRTTDTDGPSPPPPPTTLSLSLSLTHTHIHTHARTRAQIDARTHTLSSFSSQTCLLFERKIVFDTDSLSSLQSILNLKYDQPILVQILEFYTEMTRDGREMDPSTAPPLSRCYREVSQAAAGKRACGPV